MVINNTYVNNILIHILGFIYLLLAFLLSEIKVHKNKYNIMNKRIYYLVIIVHAMII